MLRSRVGDRRLHLQARGCPNGSQAKSLSCFLGPSKKLNLEPSQDIDYRNPKSESHAVAKECVPNEQCETYSDIAEEVKV